MLVKAAGFHLSLANQTVARAWNALQRKGESLASTSSEKRGFYQRVQS